MWCVLWQRVQCLTQSSRPLRMCLRHSPSLTTHTSVTRLGMCWKWTFRCLSLLVGSMYWSVQTMAGPLCMGSLVSRLHLSAMLMLVWHVRQQVALLILFTRQGRLLAWLMQGVPALAHYMHCTRLWMEMLLVMLFLILNSVGLSLQQEKLFFALGIRLFPVAMFTMATVLLLIPGFLIPEHVFDRPVLLVVVIVPLWHPLVPPRPEKASPRLHRVAPMPPPALQLWTMCSMCLVATELVQSTTL